jgi:chromosomal replication initiation ATPase DnaA
MKSKSRKREIIICRQFSSYFLRQEFNRLSLQKIADYFDQHHYSSIVHSIKQINNLIEFDFEIKEHHKKIMQRIIEMYK